MTITALTDMPRSRYTALLTYDAEDWAFHQECLDLLWHFHINEPGLFDCTVAKAGTHPDPSRFDVVYSSAWYDTRLINHPKSISQLASHSYWETGERARGRAHLLGEWKTLVAKNAEIYNRLTPSDHKQPRHIGQQFNPGKWLYKKPEPSRGTYKIGFVGHKRISKGWAIIKEAVTSLSDVELVSATWEDKRLRPEQMPGFYHGIDCYVCMSKQEGGPRPVIESMLCGTPVITTEVGQVPEMVQDEVHAILCQRDTKSLIEKIEFLKENRNLQLSMSESAREMTHKRVLEDGKLWSTLFKEVALGR